MNNECNDIYEKIKKRIEEESKKYKICYIQGPTGPKGDKGECGPATIEVGITETGEPGTSASVENVGTNQDVILNFKIPRGLDGENGDKIIVGKTQTLDANAKAKVIDTQVDNVHTLDFYIPQGFDGADGERGPQGEKGKSEGIMISGTETLEPEKEASVKDNFDGTTHNLTFLIPRGLKGEMGPKGSDGETGPQGPAGEALLGAYVSLYEDNGNSYTLKANVANQVELSKTSQSKNVNTTFTNSARIKNEGIYKIDYFFSATSSASADISIEVRKDNTTIPGTKIVRKTGAQEYVYFLGSIIKDLNQNEIIDLAVTSSVATTLTPGDETISYMNLMKID